MSSSSIAILATSTKKLIDDLLECVSVQKELWQQVPSLALEADGRIGYSDIYRYAWQAGYWPVWIQGTRNGHYNALIDLGTGRLAQTYQRDQAPDNVDLLIILSDLQKVDAQQILNDLKVAATRPYFKDYDPEKQEEWRKEMRERYNIEEIFER